MVDMDREERVVEPLSATAEVVLAAVRRSVDVVQEFLETTERQAAVIQSFEVELAAARDHIAALESETARLRIELTARHATDEIEALIEEQNVLAHLFVSSDRLASARSPREAIDVGIEVMHNLAGVHRYAIWVRPRSGSEPRMVAPTDARYRTADPSGKLLHRALASAATERDGEVPLVVPLLLDGVAVGAIEVHELVPQVGTAPGRLQIDLLQFLADRLASAMCRASLGEGQSQQEAWASVAVALPAIEETQP